MNEKRTPEPTIDELVMASIDRQNPRIVVATSMPVFNAAAWRCAEGYFDYVVLKRYSEGVGDRLIDTSLSAKRKRLDDLSAFIMKQWTKPSTLAYWFKLGTKNQQLEPMGVGSPPDEFEVLKENEDMAVAYLRACGLEEAFLLMRGAFKTDQSSEHRHTLFCAWGAANIVIGSAKEAQKIVIAGDWVFVPAGKSCKVEKTLEDRGCFITKVVDALEPVDY